MKKGGGFWGLRGEVMGFVFVGGDGVSEGWGEVEGGG